MPTKDSPVIFGMHPNADLTFRLKESQEMITTLVDTQPKDAGAAGGKSKEDIVKEKLEKDVIPVLPDDFVEAFYSERIDGMRGPPGISDVGLKVPLVVFLKQEIERFQMILKIVKTNVSSMIDAIDGTVIMTPELVDSINSIFDFRAPHTWVYDPTGVEISWLTPSLTAWISGLLNRHHQLNSWLTKGRPTSYWLTGFFNPQGFLTAMKQEVTRINRAKGWSLDEVTYTTDVTKDIVQTDDGRIEGRTLNQPSEGVLIHGLYLEGAAWHRSEKRLEEQHKGELHYYFPIIHVSAASTAKEQGPGAKGRVDEKVLEKTHYKCPVYKYPKRTDKYLIFRVFLKAEGQSATSTLAKGVSATMNWTLKGVVLLCTKE